MLNHDFHIEIIYSPYYNQLFNNSICTAGTRRFLYRLVHPLGPAADFRQVEMQHSIAWRRIWTATTQSHQALILQHYLTTRYSTRYNCYISQLSIESTELQIVNLGYPLPEGLVGNASEYHCSRFFSSRHHRSPVKNIKKRHPPAGAVHSLLQFPEVGLCGGSLQLCTLCW